MSDLGSDENISVSVSQDLAYTKSMAPLEEVWVLQWTHENQDASILLSNRKAGFRLVILTKE